MDDLRKLKGGAKHKYLRENRREILGYLSTHGEHKTLQKYGTTIDTLDRLISDNRVTQRERVNDIDRANTRIEILEEGVRSLVRDMRTLESSYSVPVEDLADNIRNYIIVPLLREAQKPGGFDINRNNRLLKLDGIIEDI